MSGTDSCDEAPYCLVLSGGGAKGIYHVGVLQALHELHIPVGAYIGNSIGALIAGGMAMGDDSIIDTMGELFTLDQVLQLPDELVKDGKLRLNARNLSSFKEIYRSVIARKGLDTTPMKQMIDRYIKEDVLRASGIDFGIVTFNISSLKPTEIFLEDMPPGTVRDYILASAAFFGFEMPEIDGESYVDGGIYNNTPYQMARQRGYLRIIVVDIAGFGIKRKMSIQGTDTVYIKNSINMGGVLDFDQQTLRRFRKLGYLDTLRIFGKLCGYRYFLERDRELERRVESELDSQRLRSELEEYMSRVWGYDTGAGGLKLLYPEYAAYDNRTLLVLLECAATVLAVERIEQWSMAGLLEELSRRKSEQDEQIHEFVSTSKDGMLTKFKEHVESIIKVGLDKELFAQTPYFTCRVIGELFPVSAHRRMMKLLKTRAPELPAGVFFVSILGKLDLPGVNLIEEPLRQAALLPADSDDQSDQE